MGVHGLTTYLRESKRNLATTRSLPADRTSQEPLHFVIDGWSFVYEIHLKSGLPWVYGGEYAEFVHLVTVVVQAWVNLGVRLTFVFDGPLPELKFATQISRSNKSHIEPSLLFFRTSSASRSTPRFLNESKILPPLSYNATIHALDRLQRSTASVDVHFADEEGDPYAVELAGRLGGYVVGNDSDFVVLNTDGYLGYIPMEEMVWTSVTQDTETTAGSGDTDDFQQVSVSKWRSRRLQMKDPKLGRGIIPPEHSNSSDLSFTFAVYSPASLASHLDLPVTLLPLLGALVGNDFSNQKRRVQEVFFGRHLTLIQRITLVADTLRTILSGGSQTKRKQKQQVESVMDLINKTVRELVARSPIILSTGEIDEIVDGIVVSTLQYAISKHDGQDGSFWPSSLCALHEPDTCPMLPMFSRNLAMVDWQEEDMESKDFLNKVDVRRLLMEAYRSGRLNPHIANALNSGTWWPRLFLESPDAGSVSLMTRPIRQWTCSILDDAVGLPQIAEEEEKEDIQTSRPTEEDESDEDELVDVVESDSDEDGKEDLLAPLRGALQQLHTGPGDQSSTASEPPPSELSQSPLLPRTPRITEYVRRGTRLADEVVEIPLLSEHPAFDNTNPTPLLLRTPDERLSVLLHTVNSSVLIGKPPSHNLIPALAIRWVISSLYERSEQTGSKEAQQACWTRREVHCFLASFDGTAQSSTTTATNSPPVFDRYVQLTAQVLQAIEAIEHLSEVLLLTDIVPSCANLFSGRLFHEYLTQNKPLREQEDWNTMLEGVEQCLGAERQKKKKNVEWSQNAPTAAPPKSNSRTKPKPGGGRSMFDLLGDMDA